MPNDHQLQRAVQAALRRIAAGASILPGTVQVTVEDSWATPGIVGTENDTGVR